MSGIPPETEPHLYRSNMIQNVGILHESCRGLVRISALLLIVPKNDQTDPVQLLWLADVAEQIPCRARSNFVVGFSALPNIME